MGSPQLAQPTDDLIVGRLDGTITARLRSGYPGGLPGAESTVISGPRSGIVLHANREDGGSVLRAINVMDGSTADLLRTPATIHAAVLGPDGLTVYYVLSNPDGTHGGIWSAAVDASRAPALLHVPGRVADLDATLVARLTFRATLAVADDGERLAVQECVLECHVLILDLPRGTVDEIAEVPDLQGLQALTDGLLVGSTGVFNLETLALVPIEIMDARPAYSEDGRSLIVMQQGHDIVVVDVESGEARNVLSAGALSLANWRPVGADLPAGWVLAVQSLRPAPMAQNRWVALRLRDGAFVPLPMLAPVPTA